MDDRRRLSFGSAAELYDRARPSYPPALVDDLLALAGGASVRALEIGAGTGKATTLFAARGVAVDAVEPSPGMARVLRGTVAEYEHVRVVEAEFESLPAPADPYHLIYSAQAFHWIDPERRFELCRAALAEDGVLAPFWNRPRWEDHPLREEIDAAYARVTPQGHRDDPMRPLGSRISQHDQWWCPEIERQPRFADGELRVYPWETTYTTAEYLDLLRTHSDHAVLDAEVRERLLEAVAEVIDGAGGTMPAPYVTHLCLARAAIA